jgi:DNA-binding GntR family transcriptional regulator
MVYSIPMSRERETSGLASRLAMQVVEYARREAIAPGTHLAEQHLAGVLKVSRSPVRRALAHLEALGVVEREANRGYFLRKLPAALGAAAPRRPADTAEEHYLRIADDRLAGRLADHVTETALMRRYDLPRRELQRILHRMEKEGWVERKPGHGWLFVALADTVEAHAQSYRFRMLLEPAAILEPGFRTDVAELERLRRDQRMLLDGGFLRLPRSRLFEIGSDFHETIVSFSGNRFMLDALKRLNDMRRLLEYRAHLDRARLLGQCREHLRLLDLIESGKLQEASRFLRRHLDVVRTIKTGSGGERLAADAVVRIKR